jgi:hypothetical protein
MNGGKRLTAALATAVVLAVTMGNAVAAAAPTAGTEPSGGPGAGDVHDDRPDDGGSVGGDQSTATTSLSAEARAWAEANGFDLAAFEDYTAPAAHTPTSADIAAFEAWTTGGSNPRNQVMEQITDLAGESVAAELWDYCNTIWKQWMNTANVGSVVSQTSGLKNVGAIQEGMFAGYCGSLLPGARSDGQGGYADAGTLVGDGFVVSSDGTTYRLHNMADGSIAYEQAAPQGAVVSEAEFPEGLTSFTDLLPLQAQPVTAEAKELLRQYALSGAFSEPADVDRDVYQAAAQWVNDRFGEYYGQCPGPTVVKGITAAGAALDAATEDKVGSSVGEREFVASFFGLDSAAASLWRLGFLPSFDGVTYRLHSGKDGEVVYQAAAADLTAATPVSPSTAGASQGSTGIGRAAVLWLAVAALAAAGVAAAVASRRRNRPKRP